MNKFIKVLVILIILTGKLVQADGPCTFPFPPIKKAPPGYNIGFGDFEIAIYNQTRWFNPLFYGDLKVRIIPVGFFFNSDTIYTPKAKFLIGFPLDTTTISGNEVIIPAQNSTSDYSRTLGNTDYSGSSGNCSFSIGFSKYKFEFFLDSAWGANKWYLVDSVYLDFSDRALTNPYGDTYDIRLDFFSKDTITFQHAPHIEGDTTHRTRFWHINSVNRDIKMWKLFGTCLDPIIPNKGSMLVDPTYVSWPIEANNFNNNLGHENPGDIGMNLTINHNVSTHDTLITSNLPTPTPTIMTVKSNVYLAIGSGKTFSMITPLVGSYNSLIVEDSALLSLGTNATLDIYPPNEVIMNYGK